MNLMIEEMCRARYVRRGGERSCPLWVQRSPQMSVCLTTQKLSEAYPLGLLWRFHYIGMID